jgi:hypothetical protein
MACYAGRMRVAISPGCIVGVTLSEDRARLHHSPRQMQRGWEPAKFLGKDSEADCVDCCT